MPLFDQNDPSKGKHATPQEQLKASLSSDVGRWFRKNYLWVINAMLAIYVILPLLAPVLMKAQLPRLADAIYRAYKPLCHQLAYRSFFLFGEQAVYPRELAGMDGLRTYEEVTGNASDDDEAAIAYRGNEQLGYKTALCQRDLAIYGSLLTFGLLFHFSKRRLKPLPWWLWILLALVPVGLDGFSQLISQLRFPALSWLAVRESTPLLRVLTGTMFGWFTGWFGFPSIEEMFNPPSKDNQLRIEEKNQ